LVRNRAIVNSSGLLIAAPAGEEILRSGTWSTVRYARSKDKRVRILER
jgi:predicted Rossmann fold nucleotide-binding protein DprA/Smf involved in DNA uptake